MNKSDPLALLLRIREEKGFQVSDDLIVDCYQLQKEHQYDKDRTTLKKMEALIENALNRNEEDKLL